MKRAFTCSKLLSVFTLLDPSLSGSISTSSLAVNGVAVLVLCECEIDCAPGVTATYCCSMFAQSLLSEGAVVVVVDLYAVVWCFDMARLVVGKQLEAGAPMAMDLLQRYADTLSVEDRF